jgi:hypothetical protein
MGKPGNKLVANKRKPKPVSNADHGLTVLRELLEQFRRLAKAISPGSAARPGKHYDPEMFHFCTRMLVDIASKVASFETAKPAAAPVTNQIAVEFHQANVSVSREERVDYSKMSNEALTKFYRARVAGAGVGEALALVGYDPAAPAAPLPAPAAHIERPPEMAVTRAPVEADEPAELLLKPNTSEPEPVAPKPAAKPARPAEPVMVVGSLERNRLEAHRMAKQAEEAARARGPGLTDHLVRLHQRVLFPPKRGW